MLTLDRTSPSRSPGIMESPHEVVQRLGRLETDNAQLVGLLTRSLILP